MADTLSGALRQRPQKQVSQNYWSLVWWRFRRNRLAMVGGVIVLAYYFICTLTAEFWDTLPGHHDFRLSGGAASMASIL